MDISVNMIDNEKINPDYYRQATLDIIKRTIEDYGYNPDKITANHLCALFRACYYALFEPDKKMFCNNKCNIPYNEYNISALYQIYIDVCEMYVCIPSNYGFSRYTGIDESVLQKYVTRSRFETQRKRADFVQNKLSDTPIGATVLANNDSDTGLMYNRQNMIERETVKQGLTLKDFVKISQKPDK